MFKYKTIHNSQFLNYEGGLNLILGDDGNRYLVMDDFYGPLTDEQVAAFYTLCEVKEYVFGDKKTDENGSYAVGGVNHNDCICGL